ncbi:MAG: hypothetical protein ACRDY3_12235 [Acidimicrobiales bacterium]
MAVGAFILNAGLGKLEADKEAAGRLHQMASGTYPVLEKLPPGGFVKALAMGEIALGGTLMLPLVEDSLAGLALSTFASGLLGLYLKTPGMRIEGSIRPSQQGTALAKDFWLLGIGISLLGHSGGARWQDRKVGRARGREEKAKERAKAVGKRTVAATKATKAAAATKATKAAAATKAAKAAAAHSDRDVA